MIHLSVFSIGWAVFSGSILLACETDEVDLSDSQAPIQGYETAEDSQLSLPGDMQALWRVTAANIDETPVMRVSLIHDQGDINATGDFILNAGICAFAGNALSCKFEGNTGLVDRAQRDASQIVVSFRGGDGFALELRWGSDGVGMLTSLNTGDTIVVNVRKVEF